MKTRESIHRFSARAIIIAAAMLSVAWSAAARSTLLPAQGSLAFSRNDLVVQGLGPRGLSAQDFNGDEIPDLVVANLGSLEIEGSQTLDVFFGNGDGTFRLAQTILAGRADMPYGMATADLRGTGACDIIVPNKCSRTVSVFLCREDGTFDEPKIFAANDTWSVSAGDINGDRRIDLAVANFDSEAITLMLGNGDGTFQDSFTIAVTAGMKPRAVEFGDLDNDGRLDLVAPSDTFNGRVAIFMNESRAGSVAFAPPRIIHVGEFTGFAVIHDLNHDGRLDVMASSLTSNHISVLMGRGDGTFEPPAHYWTGDIWPFGMFLTDMNGDGSPDMIASAVRGTTNSVLPGDGRGGFGPPQHFEVEGPSRWLTGADFNMDGMMDVAVGNYTFNGRFDAAPDQFFKVVSVMLNRSTPTKEQPTVFRTNCGGAAHASSRGILYSADSNFDGGKVVTIPDTVAGTDDPALYQTAREGNFSYTAQVAAGRSYTVKLHFAEPKQKKRNKRVFNVAINGRTALRNFDILARAPRRTATVVALRNVWPDAQGRIRLDFSAIKRGALCSAISIF